MSKRTILFYDHHRQNRKDAVRVLAATGSHCYYPDTLQELEQAIHSKTYSVQVIDIEGHRYLTEKGLDLEKSPTIVLSQEKLGRVLPYFSQIKTFTNFVAKNKDGRLSPRDLLVAVSKILYMDIFGLSKYLNWGASNRIYQVRDSTSRGDYIKSVTEFCQTLKLRKSLIQSVYIICEELLMNAIFDAPRDEHGQAKYADIDRTKKLILDPHQSARLEVATDGERLAISVSDPFGAITRGVVIDYLSKCFSGDQFSDIGSTGGAGLGLYFCLNSVSNFTINVDPGRKSEFIGLFDINLSIKEHVKSHASFHFFTTENQASQFQALDQLPTKIAK